MIDSTILEEPTERIVSALESEWQEIFAAYDAALESKDPPGPETLKALIERASASKKLCDRATAILEGRGQLEESSVLANLTWRVIVQTEVNLHHGILVGQRLVIN